MFQRAAQLVCSIIVVLVMVAGVSSCASKPEPAYASQITDGILQAMDENDYVKYSEQFDETMKAAMPEAAFQEANTFIKAKIGDYVSKEFWKVNHRGLAYHCFL